VNQIRLRRIDTSNFSARNIAVLLLALYFFLAPFEDLLTSKVGTLGKFIIILVMGIFLLPIVRRKKAVFSQEIWKLTGLVIYLIFLAWLSVVWASDIPTAISRNSAYTTLPLVFIVFSMHSYSESEYRLLKNAALFGGLTAIVYILFTQGVQHVLAGRMTINGNNDPNNLAALFLLPIGFAFDYMIETKGWRKLFFIFSFVILVYFTLLTGSRGGLLSTMVLVLAYCFTKGYTKKFGRILLFIGIVAIVAVIIVRYLPEAIFNRLFSYESYENAAQNSTQRGVIWKHVIVDVIPNMKLWGYGSGCAPLVLGEIYGYVKGVHNTYLCMIIEYGILGIPCFMLLLIRLIKKIKKKEKTIEFALLFGIMCSIFFLDAYAKKFFWNVMYIEVICLQTTFNKSVIINRENACAEDSI